MRQTWYGDDNSTASQRDPITVNPSKHIHTQTPNRITFTRKLSYSSLSASHIGSNCEIPHTLFCFSFSSLNCLCLHNAWLSGWLCLELAWTSVWAHEITIRVDFVLVIIWFSLCMCVCVCVCVLIIYIFYRW